jgi:hypothetical protein
MDFEIKRAKDYVVVTAISSYRMRYVMHRDDLTLSSPGIKTTLTGNTTAIEIAQDAVTMNECEEFSQEHVGEYIIDVGELTEDEMIDMFDKDCDYISGWDRERKIKWVRETMHPNEPLQESY